MTSGTRTDYFDGIAEQWDGWEDLDVVARKLAQGLEAFEVEPGETVLDVGCGTGNLVAALLARLSAAGRVVAVDISPRMIEVARSKIADERVTWRVADARCLPLADGSCNRAVCCSVWPHFENPRKVADELYRVLKPGGHLHVWHLSSRETVNGIHTGVGGAVGHDLLAPAEQTASVIRAAGYRVTAVVDDDRRYLVSAAKLAESA